MKVYSLVAAVQFSPVDIDLNLLARGEWDATCDRMRVWFLPKTERQGDKMSCYVMIRKFDRKQQALVCVHIVPNLGAGEGDDFFTIGILSNDDVRAKAVLGVFLGVPPIFHERAEIALMEDMWRTEPDPVMRFAANVHSAVASMSRPSDKFHELKLEPPADLMASLKPNLDTWWGAPTENAHEGSERNKTDHKA